MLMSTLVLGMYMSVLMSIIIGFRYVCECAHEHTGFRYVYKHARE